MSTTSHSQRKLKVDTMPGNPRPPSPPLTASATESAPSFPLNLPIDNLLETMQTISLAVDRTLEIMSTQTPRVAELRPATEASEEMCKIRLQLQSQYDRQDKILKDVKDSIQDGIKERLNKSVKPRVHDLIRNRVQARVKELVGRELANQIPNDLKQEITRHKREVLRVKTTLHNLEARRNNTLVNDSFRSPLTPLFRPSPVETSTFEDPTPSPLFPKTVKALVSLSSSDLSSLVTDYELVTPGGSAPDAQTDTRETLLNKFMAHIGAPYQIIPGSASGSNVMLAKMSRAD